MQIAGSNRSALARSAGVNRSTISQILEPDSSRLPNAQLAAECATALNVSTDWLLGLTDRPERPGDVIAAAVEVAQAARAVSDDQLLQWHREASGYKFRHVPATLPDMLKTKDVLRWEYEAFLSKTPDQAIGAMEDRIDWLASTSSDYEIALPIHELAALADGRGYYRGLGKKTRRKQLEHMAERCAALYPSMRLFLFDARRLFSAPVTLFGPLIGVIYVGSFYLAFRESSRVRLLTDHFDTLIREAEVDARDTPNHIAALAETLR